MPDPIVLNRVVPLRKDPIFTREAIEGLRPGADGVDKFLRTLDVSTVAPPFRATDAFLDAVLADVPDRVARGLKIAGRRPLGEFDWSDIAPEVRAFAAEISDVPIFDGRLAFANVEALTPVLVRHGNALLAVRGDGQVEALSENVSDESWIAEGAFYVDIFIQLIGTLTSVVGLSAKPLKGPSKKALEAALREWRATGSNAKHWDEIIRAIHLKDWARFLKLIHEGEFWTIFGEFFAHMFADLSWKDYVLALAKLAAWIAAGALSGGAAAAARVAAVVLDLIGLGLKFKHHVEHAPATT